MGNSHDAANAAQVKVRERAAKDKKEGGLLGTFKTWLALIAAVLSASAGIYGVLKSQAAQRERAREVSEQLQAAQFDESAGDYASAWASVQQAGKTARADGVLAKLLWGLSAQEEQVRTAQEVLAMAWLRSLPRPDMTRIPVFSDVTSKVLAVFSSDAASATGTRKADLLAHMGWAYFIRQAQAAQGGPPQDTKLDPALFFREAIAIDPTNPYANMFMAGAILESGTSNPTPAQISEANKYFAVALAARRARPPCAACSLRRCSL